MFLEAVELLIEEDTRAVQYCSASLCSIGGAGCTILYCTVLYCSAAVLQCRRWRLPSAPLFARRSGNSGYCSFKSGLGCGGPQSSGSRCPGVNYYLAIVSSSPVLDILHQQHHWHTDHQDTRIQCILSFLSVHGEMNKNLSIHIWPLVAGLWAGHHTNCLVFRKEVNNIYCSPSSFIKIFAN